MSQREDESPSTQQLKPDADIGGEEDFEDGDDMLASQMPMIPDGIPINSTNTAPQCPSFEELPDWVEVPFQ